MNGLGTRRVMLCANGICCVALICSARTFSSSSSSLHTYVDTYMQTFRQTYTCSYPHTCTYVLTYVRSLVRTYIHIHTYIHTNTRTYIHTNTLTRSTRRYFCTHARAVISLHLDQDCAYGAWRRGGWGGGGVFGSSVPQTRSSLLQASVNSTGLVYCCRLEISVVLW